MVERIAVVPAKTTSLRVPNKNFREFHNGLSLTQLVVDKLVAAGMKAHQIYVMSDEEPKQELFNCELLIRDKRTCDNDYPLTEVVRELSHQAWNAHGCECDIVWAQVCDPMFNEYERCFQAWDCRSKGYDSLAVRYKTKQYLLDIHGSPVGWGFGPWHVKSQALPVMYTFPFTLSILRPETITEVGYHVGADPLWITCDGYSIDIDTPEQFEMARLYYAQLH